MALCKHRAAPTKTGVAISNTKIMRLVEAKPFKTGVVVLTYQPIRRLLRLANDTGEELSFHPGRVFVVEVVVEGLQGQAEVGDILANQ